MNGDLELRKQITEKRNRNVKHTRQLRDIEARMRRSIRSFSRDLGKMREWQFRRDDG